MTHTDCAPWIPRLGAVVSDDGTRFRVWAPNPERVDLILLDADSERIVPMQQRAGYWSVDVYGVGDGQRYLYRIDGADRLPDPCSRSQPDGVDSPSQVVDPSAFRWGDDGFSPPAKTDVVIYECHIGTLTPEGTFESAISQLPRLRELGITTIELMPVASFPGTRNWGYDGVALFAPEAVYGGPDGLRQLVDAAHQQGLSVLLDVVYNHFGPEGNYAGRYSDYYLTPTHTTPWGEAVNFDDEGAGGVRRFVIENLQYWLHEYHIDGFRLDATQAIQDTSKQHILAEVRRQLSKHCQNGHEPLLIAETPENDVRYLRGVDEGGFGFDGVWADDFHNVLHNVISAERDGYFRSYSGTADELARTIRQGFLFEGQYDNWLNAPRGTSARHQPWRQFIYCIQNHDQIGNRPFGQRLYQVTGRETALAATMLLLLLPQTPLLFQGQEFTASSPFLYFTDHNPVLGVAVTNGRREEFASFAAFRDPTLRAQIPDPQAAASFLRSKLSLGELDTDPGKRTLLFHRELLRLRREDPILRAMRYGRPPIRTASASRAVLITLQPGSHVERRLLGANLGGEPATFDVAGPVALMLHSREERFGCAGPAPRIEGRSLHLPPKTAALFSSASE